MTGNNEPSHTYHPGYRPDIDGLRAIAVLSVVLYHAFPNLVPGGFIGVDIFFVISGFLISTILFKNLERNGFSLIDFYIRRTKRIFPILILVLIFCIILGWSELIPVDLKLLGKHIAAGAGFSSNFVLWSETGYFDKSSELKPLLHLWSLGIEEQFYLIWPMFMLLIWRCKKSPLWLIVPIGIISFITSLILTYKAPSSSFYLPFSRFWELSVGSFLAWLTLKTPDHLKWVEKKLSLNENRLRDIYSVTGFLLIVYAIVVINKEFHFPGPWALLPTLGAFLLIAAGPSGLLNHFVLSQSQLIWFGLISYPLYLWHWPLFSYLNIVKFDGSPEILQKYKLFLLVLSILLAWLSYRFVEIPIRNGKFEKTKVMILCFLMVTIGLMGYKIYLSDGMPYRYPEGIRDLIKPIDFNFADNARFGKCHYDKDAPSIASVGQAGCVEKKRPLVFIWGDSYASALYPGLKSLQLSRIFGIAQATECGTPPVKIVNWDNACRNAEQMTTWNNDVLDLLSKTHPDVLIMHAFWQAYGDNEWLLKKMQVTVPVIKSLSPRTKIIVLGFVPQWGSWSDGLPLSMYRYWKTNDHHPFPPVYMKYGLSENVKPEDHHFIQEMKEIGVTYISAHNILCNLQGCLTRVGPKPTDLTAIDQGHLSKAGSEFLIQHIEDQIFDLKNHD